MLKVRRDTLAEILRKGNVVALLNDGYYRVYFTPLDEDQLIPPEILAVLARRAKDPDVIVLGDISVYDAMERLKALLGMTFCY
jgi:hypothetical protein